MRLSPMLGLLLLCTPLNASAAPAQSAGTAAVSAARPEVAVGVLSRAPGGAYAEVHGLRMFYEVRGSGPQVLLLHGGGGMINEEWMDFLATKFEVVAVEQMGHGRTNDIAERPLRYHDMAEDTVAFLHAVGISKTSIVGFSDGGILALDLAIHHPEVVEKLVVTGANFSLAGYSSQGIAETLRISPETWKVSDDYRRYSPDGADHWPVFLTRLAKMWNTEPNLTPDEVKRIHAPTLIIAGDHDVVTPEHSVEMFRLIAGAQLCIVPNQGHGAMPRETVLAFLAAPANGKP
ncbi:MAG: alpha/beta hydrolase [Thermoanaerobaculia bacterium]